MSDNPREVAREFSEAIADESLMISDVSYGDDVVFCMEAPGVQAINEAITISSTDSSLLLGRSINSSNSDLMDVTPSITNDIDASNFSMAFGEVKEIDDLWDSAKSRSGKRFEKSTGLNYIKNGRFEMKPVSLMSNRQFIRKIDHS